jgi:hypothetical protein
MPIGQVKGRQQFRPLEPSECGDLVPLSFGSPTGAAEREQNKAMSSHRTPDHAPKLWKPTMLALLATQHLVVPWFTIRKIVRFLDFRKPRF